MQGGKSETPVLPSYSHRTSLVLRSAGVSLFPPWSNDCLVLILITKITSISINKRKSRHTLKFKKLFK